MQHPNPAVLQQLLDLEKAGRRKFIEGLKGDIASRVGQFFEAYPCFKSVDQVDLYNICMHINITHLVEPLYHKPCIVNRN